MLMLNDLNGFNYNFSTQPLAIFIPPGKTITFNAPIFSSNVMCCGYLVGGGGKGGAAPSVNSGGGGGGGGSMWFNDVRIGNGSSITAVGATSSNNSTVILDVGTATAYTGSNASGSVGGGGGYGGFNIPPVSTWGFGWGGDGANGYLVGSNNAPGGGGGAAGFGNSSGGQGNGGPGKSYYVGGSVAGDTYNSSTGMGGGGAGGLEPDYYYYGGAGGGGVGGDLRGSNNWFDILKFGADTEGSTSGIPGSFGSSGSKNFSATGGAGGIFGGGGGGAWADGWGSTLGGNGGPGFVYLLIFPEIANTDPKTGYKYGFPGGSSYSNNRISFSNRWQIRVF